MGELSPSKYQDDRRECQRNDLAGHVPAVVENQMGSYPAEHYDDNEECADNGGAAPKEQGGCQQFDGSNSDSEPVGITPAPEGARPYQRDTATRGRVARSSEMRLRAASTCG